MNFSVHSLDTAPEAAKETLAGAKKAYGFLPNLLAVMAEAPALLKSYVALVDLFDQTSLNVSERQVVLLTTSYENGCDYCVAAHSVIAGLQKVPHDVVDAIRHGRPIADRKLEALRREVCEQAVDAREAPSRFWEALDEAEDERAEAQPAKSR